MPNFTPNIPNSADESILFMHFLDVIFPLQYPMYKPGIQEGGRGWFLTLLLRMRPLYHAALALSAYHCRTVTIVGTTEARSAAMLIQQEKHLEIGVKQFNQFAQNSCPRNGTGILISVIQLMFYEVCAFTFSKSSGHAEKSTKLFVSECAAWRTHLLAAIRMYQQGYRENLTQFNLTEESRTILFEDLLLSEYDPTIAEEVKAFRFLSSSVIWLDIIASITAGTAPHLSRYHSNVLSKSSQVKLEDVMGCKNWAILQIGRIAGLHEYKTKGLHEGYFNPDEFQQTVLDISREILVPMHCSQTELKCSSSPNATNAPDVPNAREIITQIFASMASIYLHLVTHTYDELEVIDLTISRAVKLLQTEVPAYLLPALVAPLFVIGSAAREWEQPFFRNAFSSPPLLDPLFKHRVNILSILEQIWIKRRNSPGIAWGNCLELTKYVLLL